MSGSARHQVDLAVDVRADVGEGPHWDERTSSLWFVDLTAGTVIRFASATGVVTAFSVGQEVGAVIPRERGGLVLAVRDGIAVVSEGGDGFEIVVPVERENAANRMNDAKCDAAGRLFCGTTAFDFASGAGALYCVDADWSCHAVLRDVTTSNGTAWSPDSTKLYFIDSAAQGVDVFDYDLTTGMLRNRTRLVTLDREAGTPDGMTVDADGNLWVACFGGGTVRCFSPLGDLVDEVRLPVSQVTSCAFGGHGYSELYVTTASYRMTADQRAREPLAGATFVCRPGVAGVPPSTFAG